MIKCYKEPRLLRARYYPNWNIWDTVFSCNSLTAWKGIAYDLMPYDLKFVKKGIIARVGDGLSIRARRDPLIHRGRDFGPITPQGTCRFNKVSDFINEHGSWNVQGTWAILLEDGYRRDSENTNIPAKQKWFLSLVPGEIWSFTVKGAYKVATESHEELFASGASSIHPNGEHSLWNLIWKAAISLNYMQDLR